MKKKDEDAFLKSAFGASPIKRSNTVQKPVTINLNTSVKKNFLQKGKIKKPEQIPPKPKTKGLFSLEKNNINRKLKKGKIPIDKKVDFHGMTVLDAEELFLNTIITCYNQNLRCILFVTGKGVMKKNPNDYKSTKLYYGKIRKNFFDWLSKYEIKEYILNFEQANINNGGDGAFFVYLRKKN